MNVFHRGVISLSVLLIILLTCTGIAEACGAWSVIPSLNPSSYGNHLQAVTAVSPNSVYAAGYSIIRTRTGNLMKQPLIEHFHNSTSSVMFSPLIGPVDSMLTGVVALSDRNIYAVGSAPGGLIEHFNGSSWSVVNSPNPSSSDNSLTGIAVVSATNIYAVGSHAPSIPQPGASSTLIEHFNGSRWSVVSSPNVKGNSSLHAIAVVSASNIYAVGQASIPTAPANPTLIEHFNGSSWSIISSPSPGRFNVFDAVARVPKTNQGWAVGSYNTNNPDQTLTEFTC